MIPTLLRAASVVVIAASLLVIAGGVAFLARRGAFSGDDPRPGLTAVRLDAPAPPDRPLRLMFVGTSLTHGQDWPSAVAARLDACRPGGVASRVVARPAATSSWGVRALEEALDWKPDLTVVEFSVNDASLYHGVTLARSRAQHLRIIARVRAAGATPVLATMNPAYGRNGWERPGLPAYEALYRRLATTGAAGLIDIAPRWRDLPPEVLSRWLPDGLHPVAAAATGITVPAMVAALAPAVCADNPHAAPATSP